MTIQEYRDQDQPQNNKPAPVVQMVDANELVNAYFSKQAQIGSAPPTPQERSEILETANYLKSQGWDDQSVLALAHMSQAALKDAVANLQRQNQVQAQQTSAQNLDNSAEREITLHLRGLFKDFPELKDDEGSIRHKFYNDPEFRSIATELHRTGQVPVDKIIDKLDSIAEGFLKRLGKTRNEREPGEQPPQRLNKDKIAAASGQTTPNRDNPMDITGVVVDVAQLAPHQLDAFSAFKLSNQQLLGMNRADAEKLAFKHAIEIPRDTQTRGTRIA